MAQKGKNILNYNKNEFYFFLHTEFLVENNECENICSQFLISTRLNILGEKLEFSSGHGEVNPRQLGEELEMKRVQYQNNLEKINRQCKRNEVRNYFFLLNL